jgi:hypothetical protein
LDAGTPPPITALLTFLDLEEQPLQKASIGDPIHLVVSSEQAGPHNMMLTECTATRIGGEGEAIPFTIIDNGYGIWIMEEYWIKLDLWLGGWWLDRGFMSNCILEGSKF